MDEPQTARRIIEVNRQIIGPAEPRPRNIRARRLEDYPHVPAAYRDVAQRLSSPLLLGPPICDELMALVQHLFTEEEAGAVRHLRQFAGRSAADVARAEHRPVEQIEPILRQLATVKRVISSSGRGDACRYRVLPIMPGIFEMCLIGQTPESLTDWHRRFIELFEALFETGYAASASGVPRTLIRYLPVGKVIDSHPMALPSDKLEIVLDQFRTFGIGQCQCRMATQMLGRGCGKPLGNCTVMGDWAVQGIREGIFRQVSKKEVLAIKAEAESHGMVNWMMNVASAKGQCSCSCCGCCCHAMRIVTEFNVPSIFAPPHFLPRWTDGQCTGCGRCAKSCPMGAIAVDVQAKTCTHRTDRCIGCGLCAAACQSRHAIVMEPVPDYRLPYRSWFSLLAHTAPGMAKSAWNTWRKRRNS